MSVIDPSKETGGGAAAWALVLCVAFVGCDGRSDADAPPDDAAAAPAASEASAPGETIERFEYSSYKDVQALFEKLGYTPERWQAGIREVPKIYFATVPERWRSETSREVSVTTKKRLFFRALAPIVLYANKLIGEDRSRAEELVAAHRGNTTLAPSDAEWLVDLAVRYGVLDAADRGLEAIDLDELLARVDVIPVSLALSQAAEESGWGTSRFAAEGNALFGQWAWGDTGIKPKEQRSGKGNYGIAAFDTTLASVQAYMHNLNTHRAYEALRQARAERRRQKQPISGRALAETLTSYSERGAAYVETLLTIMNANRLDPTDGAYLGEGPVYLMVPAGATGE